MINKDASSTMSEGLEQRLEMLSVSDLRSLASMLAIVGRSKLGADKLVKSIVQEISTPRILSRNIDDLPDGVQYSDSDTFYRLENALVSYNCHHGQRKLFFTMLEFLTMCAQRIPLTDALVVYVGAAPGYNMRMISELFPCAMYLLIDPAPFDIKDSHNLRIWHRLFTDESIEDIKKYQALIGKSCIIFVSDIRMSANEEDVGRDMASQQRWGVKLKSAAMMLKFKLPYFGSSTTTSIVKDAEDKLDAIRHELRIPSSKNKSVHSFLYLDGIVLTQLYAPLRSAETRLVVFHPRFNSGSHQSKTPTAAISSPTCLGTCLGKLQNNGVVLRPRATTAAAAKLSAASQQQKAKYDMRYWDYKKYEAKMNAFNIVNRSLLSYRSLYDEENSAKLGAHLLGYSSDYESVAEYQIAFEYLNWERQCTVNIRRQRGGFSFKSWARLSLHGGDVTWRRRQNNVNASDGARDKSKPPTLENVVKFLHWLNMRLVNHYSSKISLVLCAIKTMATHTKKYNEMDEQTRMAQIRMVSKVVLSRFEKQMRVVASSTVLTHAEKQELINSVANEVNSLSRDNN